MKLISRCLIRGLGGLLFFWACSIQALGAEKISLNVHHILLSDAVLLMAKFLDKNVLLSPSIVGVTTLSIKDVYPEAAFDFLLVTHGLEKWEQGNLIFIAPREKLIAIKQAQMKWQELVLKTAPVEVKLVPLRYAHAQTIAESLVASPSALLSPRGIVKADKRTNSIYIEEIASNLPKIMQVIRQFDIPVKQILIEARLLSMDEGVERELGLHFNVRTSSETAIHEAKLNIVPLVMAKLADSASLEVKLSALEKAGRVEVISSPRLFTANQQTASIEAGEEVPYQESSEHGGTTIAFKKAVLSLQVTPQILPGKKLMMQLKINQDRPSQHIVLGMPSINTHQINTQVMVQSGETVVLGGIYERQSERVETRVPLLSRIPIIGEVFHLQHQQESKRLILIIVRPRIIEPTT